MRASFARRDVRLPIVVAALILLLAHGGPRSVDAQTMGKRLPPRSAVASIAVGDGWLDVRFPPLALSELGCRGWSPGDTIQFTWGVFQNFADAQPPHGHNMTLIAWFRLPSAPPLTEAHLDSAPAKRRQAIAQKYQDNWERDALRIVMANIPTYMIWDDHEVRDGWGSWAAESPTLAQRYPRGEKIFRRHDAFFADARDVYLHFQMSHNPAVDLPLPGQRKAMPLVVRCGRVLVLMLDSRGDRDLWRKESPILGTQQWIFIESLLANLPAEVDALMVVTAAPMATLSPQSLGQRTLGRLQPDVRLFRRGDMQGMDDLINSGGTPLFQDHPAAAGLNSLLEKTVFEARSVIDEVRDQWSHHTSRPEQERLIRKLGEARLSNRLAGSARAVAFLGGDIHLGGIWDISAPKNATMPCIVSSGISQLADKTSDTLLAVDQNFEIAPGLKSKQRLLIQRYNFGVMQVVPTGGTPVMVPAVVPQGASRATSGQLGGVVG